MRRFPEENVFAAVLSLLVPGLGQLAQERNGIGFLHLAWAAASFVALFAGVRLGIPTALVIGDLLVVTTWSVVDAVIWRPRNGVTV